MAKLHLLETASICLLLFSQTSAFFTSFPSFYTNPSTPKNINTFIKGRNSSIHNYHACNNERGAIERLRKSGKSYFLQQSRHLLSKDGNINQNPAFSFSSFLTRRNILQTLGVGIISLPFLAEIYARTDTPKTTASSILDDFSAEKWNTAEDITFVFHGAGGEDAYTDSLMSKLSSMAALAASVKKQKIVKMVNWSVDSKDTLRASFNGIKVGRDLAKEFLRRIKSDGSKGAMVGGGRSALKNIHVIGISVGAFAANSFVQELRSCLEQERSGKAGGNDEDDGVYVQLTLLDPFTQRAVLGVGYGNKEFGKGADYAQQFMNTDDPVPSTNAPLQHCATTDVTSLRPPEIFGHDWPLVMYSNSLDSNKIDGDFVSEENRRTRGSLVVL